MYGKEVIVPVPAVIRTNSHMRRVCHFRKEIRKIRMETMRCYDNIDALIDHIVHVHEKMQKCILRGSYSRGRGLNGLMSDMIKTLNRRDYGQILHQA